jgi:hypothetical protein
MSAAAWLQILRGLIIAGIDLIGQESLLVVGPELADLRVPLDHGVDELPVLTLASADEDVLDDVAEVVKLNGTPRRGRFS